MNSSERKTVTNSARTAIKSGNMAELRKQVEVINKATDAKKAQRKAGKLF